MAIKKIDARIQNKNDFLSAWQGGSIELLPGEIAFVKVLDQKTDETTGETYTVPAVLMKVGDVDDNGNKISFDDLPWLSAKASDVFDWAKKPTKPTYSLEELGIEIEDEVTENSSKLITSRGVFNALKKLSISDNGSASFVQADWTETNPAEASFIQNKPSTTSEVTKNSESLITSGGVYEALKNIAAGGSGSAGGNVQSDWAQTDETQPDYIKNKIGDTYFGTATDVYDMSTDGLFDDSNGIGACMAQVANQFRKYPQQVSIKVRNKVTQNETAVGSGQLVQAQMDGLSGGIISVNTTATILDFIEGNIESTPPLIDESIPFAVIAGFSIEENIALIILLGVSSSNYDVLVEYQDDMIRGLPENVLGDEFENINGKLSLTLGKTIAKPVKITNSYIATLESPHTTSPFILWSPTITNFSTLKETYIMDNLKEGTPITVSYIKNEDLNNIKKIEDSVLFTSTILDAQFQLGDDMTGYWALINSKQSVEEILTYGIWERADKDESDSDPTIVVCLAKHNTSGRCFLTIGAPEHLTIQNNWYFVLDLTTDDTELKIIKLPNEALNIDNEPQENSTNLVTSGGVFNAINAVVPVDRGGTGYSTMVDTIYTTARYRASTLHSTETAPAFNGAIAWTYE